MSIFGKIDAATVVSNPYFVEAGEYEAEVSKAYFNIKNDGSRQFRIIYTITDETSRFYKKPVTQFFNLVSADMTMEDIQILSIEEQQRISDTMSKLKLTLCGNDANSWANGLGVPAEDLNDDNWDPAVLVGTKVNLAVKNFGENNEGVGVQWVNIRD